MQWVNIATLVIAFLTLFFSFYNARKSRRISVVLSEKQKRHDELFKHINEVLNLGRKSFDVEEKVDRQNMLYELLSHKVYLWVYLNKENKFSREMRERCNEYIFALVSGLEIEEKEERKQRLSQASYLPKHIWVLIDKYIEEEDKLRSKLI